MFSVGDKVKFSIRWKRILCGAFRDHHSVSDREELVKYGKMTAIILGRAHTPGAWKIQWENGETDAYLYHYTNLVKVM